MSKRNTGILPRAVFLVVLFVVALVGFCWIPGSKGSVQGVFTQVDSVARSWTRKKPQGVLSTRVRASVAPPHWDNSLSPSVLPSIVPSPLSTGSPAPISALTSRGEDIDRPPTFAEIRSGINVVARMVVSEVASLTYAGGEASPGTINANRLENRSWSNPAGIGSSTPNTGIFTALTTNNTLIAKDKVTFEKMKDGFLRVNGVGELSASQISLSSSSDVADRLPLASGGTGLDLSSTGIGSLLSFSSVGQMSVLSPVGSGYVLTSNGTLAVPSWQAIPGGANIWTSGTITGDNRGEDQLRAHYK